MFGSIVFGKIEIKKKKVNFPYNFSGVQVGFLDPLILQQNYQLQIINPL